MIKWHSQILYDVQVDLIFAIFLRVKNNLKGYVVSIYDIKLKNNDVEKIFPKKHIFVFG